MARFVVRSNKRAYDRLKDGKPIFTDSLMRDEPQKKTDDKV
jgi:hypothetical protein